MDPLTVGLISGGTKLFSGLLSGIFGRKSAKKQEARARAAAREDYIWERTEGLKHLVAGAEAAGFNPLTVLRGGGGAGFTQTHAPVLSASAYGAAALGDALSAGLETGVQAAFDYNPLDEEKAELELDIMRGQLRRINQDFVSRVGGAPVATGSRYKLGDPALSKMGPVEVGRVTVTNPHSAGKGWDVNPNFADAEMYETRYGDVAQEIGGAANVVADTLYNQRGRLSRWSASLSRAVDASDKFLDNWLLKRAVEKKASQLRRERWQPLPVKIDAW